MGWMFLGGAALTAASTALAYSNAKEEQERRNAMVDARITATREQRKHEKRMFEVQTFSNYYGAEAAGTMRIARQMSMGAKGGTYALNRADVFRAHRDFWAGRQEQIFKDKQADRHIQEMKAQKRDPSDAGMAAGLETAFSTAISFIPVG